MSLRGKMTEIALNGWMREIAFRGRITEMVLRQIFHWNDGRDGIKREN